ncbi:MAG: hypothetical protein AAF408_14380 [Pseudomonadota bacterium]
MITLSADGISLTFDPDLGLIEEFCVTDGETDISPLHRAPWVGMGETLPDDIAPHLVRLGGDFFCAPFASTEGASPPHGWPPNSAWVIREKTATSLRAELGKTVFGARLEKEITLYDGHPFVYQRHTFFGGQGRLPVSNHANLSLPNGGLIRTSPKSCWRTPPIALEVDATRGRSGLRYPAQSETPTSFPAVSGSVDLTRYPWFSRCEDFVVGLDAPGAEIGWTAVTRPQEGDVFLSLKPSRILPMTMLWHSNGGRDYPPWSGRHFGCLGIEEGAAATVLGEDVDADWPASGLVTLVPDGRVAVTHVIGAFRWPGGTAIDSVSPFQDHLVIRDYKGADIKLPFDPGLLRTA